LVQTLGEGKPDEGVVAVKEFYAVTNSISQNEVQLTRIGSENSRQALVENTRNDSTLATLRKLANSSMNDYSWENGLLMRKTLDDLGRVRSQICLPVSHRARVLELAQESFGHSGKHRVGHHVQKLLYWPSLWRDVIKHCASCRVCQRTSKQKPRRASTHAVERGAHLSFRMSVCEWTLWVHYPSLVKGISLSLLMLMLLVVGLKLFP